MGCLSVGRRLLLCVFALLHLVLRCGSVPVLQSFDWQHSLGLLTLNFNEDVRVFTLDPTKLVFQGAYTANSVTYTYRPVNPHSLVTKTDASTISFYLGADDLAAIKVSTIYREKVTSYLALDVGFIKALASDDYNAAISNATALQVNTYTPDESRVGFLRFDLDMSLGNIKLYFSEPVKVLSFKIVVVGFVDLGALPDILGLCLVFGVSTISLTCKCNHTSLLWHARRIFETYVLI